MAAKFPLKLSPERDNLLSNFSKAVLDDRYKMSDESYQDLFARVASFFADDQAHAQRLYDYISQLWFMPATPILSNGGTSRGLTISCFLNETTDTLEGIVNLWNENVWLAANGGGIGSYWGNIRSINEQVRGNGRTSGIIPFIKVQDSLTLAISQGSLRRGNSAVYLPISHPEIEEFIDLRRPTGGDVNRRALNINHGIVISDAFMHAVRDNLEWSLISPKNQQEVGKVKARDLWIKILTARLETGEPYLLFIDKVNRHLPKVQQQLGLQVKTSNLCSEITLPTGVDHLGNERTAVCCLSSVNLEYFEQWQNNPLFVSDIMRFLDNVLQNFIDNAPKEMKRAAYSAMRERSVGLGVMGFHSFLQRNRIPLESALSKAWNKKIFTHLEREAKQASVDLAETRGPCPDALECGIMERFSNTMAIAPTASISIIASNTSPGIEPFVANSYTHKTLTGSFAVRNKYLEGLLAEKGINNEDTWASITAHEGSVQHLNVLDEAEKQVFKTAYEIDQRWLIKLASDRGAHISQAQSLNIFLRADINKSTLHEIHYYAWSQEYLKSLYYCRSMSIQRAEKISHVVHDNANNIDLPTVQVHEECLACQ